MSYNVFKKADTIWSNATPTENEYAEFIENIEYSGDDVIVRLSVCGDYTLFVNGAYIASNQYADFSHYKIYDEIDVTPLLHSGKNDILFLVWYFGKSGMRYHTEKPGLTYEIISNNLVVAQSNINTLSRKHPAYVSGTTVHKISPQLGYSFAYDATKETDMTEFTHSFVIHDKNQFFRRPVQKLELHPIQYGKITKNGDRYIVDLGKETVGLCSFSIISDKEQCMNFSYGELLVNEHVKRKIGMRDFSFDYIAKTGKNAYTNYMLRIACRYIEIECEYPVNIEYIGIIPQVYPAADNRMPELNGTDRRIYEICLNTLKLCMMEHYVDCPWREQCLYAFDARNQMLAGYYAFNDKNSDYARANLLLISKDNREDNLLSICFPSNDDLTIPSFSLFYIIAVNEYMQYTGDYSLGEEVFAKLKTLLDAFITNMSNGLVEKFPGKNHWNYYDWSLYAEGRLHEDDAGGVDFMLNAIAVLGLSAYNDICTKLGKINEFADIAECIKENTRNNFYNPQTHTFFISESSETPTELANAFAIVSGIATDDLKKEIAEKLANNCFEPSSLSMKAFKYDALLSVDKQKYKDTVLNEIRCIYTKMLDEGSTTVWETANGASGFSGSGAGSLCHGWSAIPIYYYHIFQD